MGRAGMPGRFAGAAAQSGTGAGPMPGRFGAGMVPQAATPATPPQASAPFNPSAHFDNGVETEKKDV